MIDAAIRAPSGSNSQPWIWLVVRDQAKREAIAGAVRQHFGGTGSIENLRRNAEQLEDPARRRMMLGAVGFFENVAAAPVLIIPCLVGVTSPVTDGMSLLAGSSIYGAVQNMMLAARSLGLGTVMTTLHTRFETEVKAFLGIPGDVHTAALVPIGYPSAPDAFGPGSRRPLETAVFGDRWDSPLFEP